MEQNPFQAASDAEPATAAPTTPNPPPKPSRKRPSVFGRLIGFVLIALLAVGGWFGYQTYATGSESSKIGEKVKMVGMIVSIAKSFLPGASESAATEAGPSSGQSPSPVQKSSVSSPMASIDPTVPNPDPTENSTAPVVPTDSPPADSVPAKPMVTADTPKISSDPTKAKPAPSPNVPKIDPTEILRKKIEAEPQSSPALYVKLAETYLSQKTPEKAEEILAKGLALNPLDGDLTLALADSLSAMGKHADAWMLIARTGRIGDLRFASKMLELGLASGKHDETLVILDPSFTGDMDWSSADWKNIAHLHEKVGNLDNAVALFSKIPDGQIHLLRIRAKEANASEDFENALKLQGQYVNQLVEPDPEAWTLYADLHRQAGNNEEADEAYRRAFADLKKRDAAKG